MPTALLFPGQGSQTADMREVVQEVSPQLLERAVEAVGEDPFERVWEEIVGTGVSNLLGSQQAA